jgi:polyhydroxybutyrate depolymerase
MRAKIVVALAVLVAAGAVGCGGDDPAAGPAAAAKPTTAGGTTAAQAAGACAPLKGGPLKAGAYRVPVQDGRVPVILHVPRRKENKPLPLVVQLPGTGQDGIFAERYTGYSKLADREGFIVAYPTAAGKSPSWNVSGNASGKPDDVAYLKRVIKTITGARVICADPSRVTVTGASNGGGMAARLACDAPQMLAAAAPVAGGYSSLPPCRSRAKLPLLEIHSLTDSVVPYRGKGPDHAGAVSGFLADWRARNGCDDTAQRSAPARGVTDLRWTCDGAPVEHVRLADAPHGWYGGASLDADSTTARTWRFLKAHRLDTKD